MREDITHVYTRQHKAVGLQTPWEGPFKIASRPSRSTVQIEVGNYKNGEKRYEIRHFNDLKLAHPDSLAAPAVRPALGRPAKATAQSKGPSPTDGQLSVTPKNRLSPTPSANRFPNPTSLPENATDQAEVNKRSATEGNITHATSTQQSREPSRFRPVRTTRNPNPNYKTWSFKVVRCSGTYFKKFMLI